MTLGTDLKFYFKTFETDKNICSQISKKAVDQTEMLT